MDNLAAFDEPKPKEVETPKEEKKPFPRAVDSLGVAAETVKSAHGTFRADIDYEKKEISLWELEFTFDQLAEFATFIIGLAGRVDNH